MRGPINEAIKATGLIIEGFQQSNSDGPSMCNNYIAKVLLHTFKSKCILSI